MEIAGAIIMVGGLVSAVFGIILNNTLEASIESFLGSGEINFGTVFIIIGVMLFSVGLILLMVGLIKSSNGNKSTNTNGYNPVNYSQNCQQISNNNYDNKNPAAFCPYCGQAISVIGDFCPHCGKRIR